MPKEFSRAERVAEQLQRELAHLIAREVKDPRITGIITCTSVEVSRDLSYAKVFVTLLNNDDEKQIKANLAALNHASGYLRTLLAKIMQMRTVPQLRFVYDHSISEGNRLQAIINKAVASDDEHE